MESVLFLTFLISVLFDLLYLKIFFFVGFIVSILHLILIKRNYKLALDKYTIFASLPCILKGKWISFVDIVFLGNIVLLLILIESNKPNYTDYDILSGILINLLIGIKRYQLEELDTYIKISDQGIIKPGILMEFVHWSDVKNLKINSENFEIKLLLPNAESFKAKLDKSVDRSLKEIELYIKDRGFDKPIII